MFGRKQREAIGTFHPLHQGLIWHRYVSASLRPGDWALLIHSLAGHDAVVRRRRWAPPTRAGFVLVPLIRVLSEDMGPDGVLSIAADLRGPNVQGKLWPPRQIPWRQHRIRRVVEQWAIDPWLRMHAVLRDGSVLEVSVTDRVRYRDVRKVSASGKLKTKRKTKVVHQIRVSRRLPAGAAVRRPGTPPPRWIRVKVREGRHTMIRANAKLPGASYEPMQTDMVLDALTELFRWTPPGAARPLRRTG